MGSSYHLVGCPAGYEMSTVQSCEICTAGYFCIGGAAAGAACPAGTFSLPKSNSSKQCENAIFVLVSVTLGVTQALFTLEVQQQYVHALAVMCLISDYRVAIQSLASSRRSLNGYESIQVVSKIASSDIVGVQLVISRISQDALNAVLIQFHLPNGTLDSYTVESPIQNGTTASWIIAITCAFAAFSLLLAWAVWCLSRKTETPREKELRMKVLEIRELLRITARDGYAVGQEAHSFLKMRYHTYLSSAQMEAAANLSLMQDFDINQFDAFCSCLGLSSLSGAAAGRYELFGQWILGCCEFLLLPDVPNRHFSVQILDQNRPESTGLSFETASERFRYFETKVMKARIWLEDQNLFLKLKKISKEYMDNLSRLCRIRYEELSNEPSGQELIQFRHDHLDSSRTSSQSSVYCE